MRRRAALAAALAGAARAGQTGLKGIDCIADTACVFSDDANGQLCYYDLATGEASLLTADVGAPRDVQLSRDGTLVVASDWGRNAVAKITVATKKVATVSCLGEDRWTVESTDGDIPVPNVREIFSYSYETRRLGTFSYSYDFVDDDGCDAATAPEGIALLSGGRYGPRSSCRGSACPGRPGRSRAGRPGPTAARPPRPRGPRTPEARGGRCRRRRSSGRRRAARRRAAAARRRRRAVRSPPGARPRRRPRA